MVAAMHRVLPLLLACSLLAGCSGEPSEDEMRSLVESFMRTAVRAKGQQAFTQFAAFRKQGCVDSKGKPGHYDCYYAATFAPQSGQPPLSVNGKGRFSPDAKGFAFEDLGAQPR